MTIDAPNRTHLPALRALWQEAFGDTDAFLNTFEQTAFSPDRCRCIVEGDAVIAALYWFDCTCRENRIAYLYAIATATSYRGHGMCRTLMEDTHRHLRALGYAGALLVPGSEALFAFYQKAGYRTCSTIGELTCSPSTDTVSLLPIDIDEYARLRRTYLPSGGVVQEGENLTFLKAQAALYAGNSFLLAARHEQNTLVGVELLGNVSVAPAIVAALGCTTGRFRTPGAQRPFAMYLPLDPSATPPSYFGLAFD